MKNQPEASKVTKSIEGAKKRKRTFTQFNVHDNSYKPMGEITLQKTLDSGIYNIKDSMSGPVFEIHDLETDEILRFDDSRYNEILEEVKRFWPLKSEYKKLGFTHKRGILLYGAPGTGKSCLLKILMEDSVDQGDVVFVARSSGLLMEALQQFREVEPDRKALVIIEDIDRIIEYNERAILEMFDGDFQTDNVLFLSTTNYITRIPARVLRPGRFDRKVEVHNPPKSGRLAYLKHKLGMHEGGDKLEDLADKTDGFSFAQLREFLVSVYCLKTPMKKAIERIVNNLEESWTSEETLDRRLSEALVTSKVSKLLGRIQ